MANTHTLRRRIRSVSNTQQITKAMELVAAAKMRRVQAAVVSARAYSDAAANILARLSATVEAHHHPYFTKLPSDKSLFVVFTSDSGLAGAYNANIFNLSQDLFRQNQSRPQVVAIGKKGAHHFSHFTGLDLIGEYENIADDPPTDVLAPIRATIADGLADGSFGGVNLIYTEFRSSLNHQAINYPLTPIEPKALADADTQKTEVVFEFEPNPEAVLDSAVRLYVESRLRRARVEAAASEHAMRMLSMSNANHNAGELIDNLTLELNATRQAAITAEMAEIIGGAEGLA